MLFSQQLYNGFEIIEFGECGVMKDQDMITIQFVNWTLCGLDNKIFNFPGFVMQPRRVRRALMDQVHPEWCGFNHYGRTAI
jgi:hypothetical protein